MKRVYSIVSAITILWLMSCHPNEKKEKEDVESSAQDRQIKEQDELRDANKAIADTSEAMQQFKAEADARMNDMDRKIKELRERMKSGSKGMQTQYANQIDSLAQRNNRMRAMIHDYKRESRQQWETFRMQVDSSLNNLDRNLSRLSEKHK